MEKIFKQIKRMCGTYRTCQECPLQGEHPAHFCIFKCTPDEWGLSEMKESAKGVEEWVKEHPAKTRGELFLERNPQCKHSEVYHDIPDIRPCDYDESINFPSHCCCFNDCQECKKDYWEEPVE